MFFYKLGTLLYFTFFKLKFNIFIKKLVEKSKIHTTFGIVWLDKRIAVYSVENKYEIDAVIMIECAFGGHL